MGLGSICQSELLWLMGVDFDESEYPVILPVSDFRSRSGYQFGSSAHSYAVSSERHIANQDYI